jgi:hypothetical protein
VKLDSNKNEDENEDKYEDKERGSSSSEGLGMQLVATEVRLSKPGRKH